MSTLAEAEECQHERRIVCETEDYLPVGVVRLIQCVGCMELVGTKYVIKDAEWVEGLDANYELPVSTRLICPSFERKE